MVNYHTHKYVVMEKPRNHPVMEMTYLLDCLKVVGQIPKVIHSFAP